MPVASIRIRLVEKTAMPSTRRSLRPVGVRAAPTLAASNGLAGWPSELVALPEEPFVERRHRPLQGQALHVVAGQPGLSGAVEAAGIGDERRRPQRDRHRRVGVRVGRRQLRQQPLAAVHDELEILDDGRLVGQDPR